MVQNAKHETMKASLTPVTSPMLVMSLNASDIPDAGDVSNDSDIPDAGDVS